MESNDRDEPRKAEMLVPFVLYLIVIVGGLATYITIGLTHH